MVSISKLNPAFCMQTVHQLSELNASMYEMEHIRSGIKLIWLDRQTENKTFSVTFRTYPWDDTGVFHILEHSVHPVSRQGAVCGTDEKLLEYLSQCHYIFGQNRLSDIQSQ